MVRTALGMTSDLDICSMYPTSLYNQKDNEKYLMRVLNKKYWPHQIRVTPTQIEKAERMCYANLKSANWRSVGMYFAFKNGEDATWFALACQ